MRAVDALIIGGGIIGTSILYRLAEQGLQVVLIEKGTLAAGASGACDKAIFLQSKKAGLHLKLAKESLKIYQQLEAELGVPLEFDQAGGMIAIETEAQQEIMKAFVSQQQESGIDIQLLSTDEARSIQPAFAPHLVGSTWSQEDGDVNPLLVTFAFAQAALRFGAEILTNTEVIGIRQQHARVTGVETSRGFIATDMVINAAGSYAPSIGHMVGIDIPVKPRRGVILITEKVPPMIYGNVLSAQYITSKHLQAKSSAGEVPSQYGVGLSLGQTKAGNLLIGGSREFVGYNRSITPHLFQSIAEHAVNIVPELRGIRIIRTMVGFRPLTPDGLPIISSVPNLSGFIIAAGHEGDGIALAPITGLLVTNLIAGEGRYFNLTKTLSLERFALAAN